MIRHASASTLGRILWWSLNLPSVSGNLSGRNNMASTNRAYTQPVYPRQAHNHTQHSMHGGQEEMGEEGGEVRHGSGRGWVNWSGVVCRAQQNGLGIGESENECECVLVQSETVSYWKTRAYLRNSLSAPCGHGILESTKMQTRWRNAKNINKPRKKQNLYTYSIEFYRDIRNVQVERARDTCKINARARKAETQRRIKNATRRSKPEILAISI